MNYSRNHTHTITAPYTTFPEDVPKHNPKHLMRPRKNHKDIDFGGPGPSYSLDGTPCTLEDILSRKAQMKLDAKNARARKKNKELAPC